MDRVWIWTGNETPNSGSGIRRAYVYPGATKNTVRVRSSEQQKAPDVLTLEAFEAIKFEPDPDADNISDEEQEQAFIEASQNQRHLFDDGTMPEDYIPLAWANSR